MRFKTWLARSVTWLTLNRVRFLYTSNGVKSFRWVWLPWAWVDKRFNAGGWVHLSYRWLVDKWREESSRRARGGAGR